MNIFQVEIACSIVSHPGTRVYFYRNLEGVLRIHKVSLPWNLWINYEHRIGEAFYSHCIQIPVGLNCLDFLLYSRYYYLVTIEGVIRVLYVVCQQPGLMRTWQIVKNETHVYHRVHVGLFYKRDRKVLD